MEIVKYLLAGCLLLSVTSCTEEDFCNCFQRTGGKITEERSLGPFSKIELNNNIDLEVIPDTMNAVFITCGDNLIDGISTEVLNSKLILRNNNKCNWLRDLSNKFTARVHVKNLDYILSQGSGDITFLDTLRTSPFLLETANGTGEYRLLFSSNNAELKLHSGPADIYASGKIDQIYFFSGANGYIYAEDLISQYCTVNTASTGDCRVQANVKLDVNIDYIGDVFYRGAATVSRTGSGSGQLLPL
jgi:hypothetical protein